MRIGRKYASDSEKCLTKMADNKWIYKTDESQWKTENLYMLQHHKL